jgi:signal transduction histidine kinase
MIDKLVERQLDCAAVLRGIPTPLMILDTRLRIVMVNRALGKMFYLDHENLAGVSLSQLTEPIWSHPPLTEILTETSEGLRSKSELELEADVPNRGRRTLAVGVQEMPADALNERLLAVTVQDVTPLASAVREKQVALESVETSNAFLAEFATYAAHELQAPLNRISNYCELVEISIQQGNPDRTDHFLASIRGQAESLKQLIHNLLLLGRIRVKFEAEDIPLSDVLPRVLETLNERVIASGARVEWDSLPILKGSRAQFTQLFQNLLDNAIRYRKTGVTPHIRLEARTEGGNVEIRVRDNGIGFDQDDAGEIFKPFRRLQKSSEEGTGLGLAICARIMEVHGGTISVESVPMQGTTFILKFPAR